MVESSTSHSDDKTCINCNEIIRITTTYCPKCGNPQTVEKKFDDIKNEIVALFIFFFLQVIGLLFYTYAAKNAQERIILILLLHGIDLVFAIIYFKSIYTLFRVNNRIVTISLVLIPIAILSSSLVNYLVDKLNYILYNEYYKIVFDFSNMPFPTIFELIEIALLPALFEEIAFRGVIYNMSLKFNHNNHLTAIIVSSGLFFIIHMSFISFFWMLPFAFFLGYLRRKYDSLIPGMVLHFFFNATAYGFQEWF